MSQYYYLDEQNEQRGPVDAADLPSRGVTGTTMVWAYWMDEWTPANQVPELAQYFLQPHPQPPADNHAGIYAPQPGNDYPQPSSNDYPQPGNDYPQPGNDYPRPSNHLVGAILSTIFCCPPLGIVGIVYAAKVNPLCDAGDHQGATNAAQKAKTWTIASVIAGLIASIIYAIILIFSNSNDYSTSSLGSPQYGNERVAHLPADDGYSDDGYSDDGYSDDIDDSDVVLRLAVEYAKSSLPTTIEDGIVITDMQLTSDYLMYIAECDEDMISINDLNAVKSEIKNEVLSDLKAEAETDPDSRDFINECKKARKGIAYKYVGTTTGKTCTVRIPYTEL